MKKIAGTFFSDGKNIALAVTTAITISGVAWKLVQDSAELKVKKEYDKILIQYAVDLATKCN